MRYYITMGVLCALLSYGLWQTYSELQEVRSTVSTQSDQIDALRAAQARTAASLSVLAAKSQASRSEVTHALAQDPAYRDAAVPAAVVDSLCKRLRCKR